jgi:AraC-like DNA-binding protein
VPKPGRSDYAFLVPGLANLFQALRVSAAIREEDHPRVTEGFGWRAIHSTATSIFDLEVAHGVLGERHRYNARAMQSAKRSRKLVRGEHAGASDLFVPIILGGRVPAILVTGPFSRAWPTSEEVLSRWHAITGRQGHPSDPQFASYVATTLETLVLEGGLALSFERFVVCFTRLIAGREAAAPLVAEADSLREKLEGARFVDRTWEAASSMIDEGTALAWSSAARHGDLERLGVDKMPDRVLVGLVVGRSGETDPVDEALRRHAFQRACVDLARRRGEVISGRIGDHGVTFLSAESGSSERRRTKLVDLAERAAALAKRKFGLDLYAGLSTLPSGVALSAHYQTALGATEVALSRGERIVLSSADVRGPKVSLHDQRRHLGDVLEERPDELPARFDRYLEAVALRCSHRLEPARAHLEAGFERLAEKLIDSGALDEKSFADACEGLDRAAQEARTLADLFAVYRRVVSDLAKAVQRPTEARHDRSLERARTHIDRHYSEKLNRDAVARLAGFAPTYFSELFRRREGVTFEKYVRRLRVERAKHLLVSTKLELARVAELSGLGGKSYLVRVFKREVGTTPMAYRRRGRPR